MRRLSLGVALATVAAVSPLSAQTWQAIGTPDNSGAGAYWNNVSDDNTSSSSVCNAGAIFTNTPAQANTACVNQAPVNLVPLTPAPLTTSNFFLGGAGGSNPGGFQFAGGTYSFGFIGRIEGIQSTSWGAITSSGTVLTSAQLLANSQINISGPFAIWITQALPAAGAGTVFTSNMQTWSGSAFASTSNQQFAVFTNSSSSSVSGGIINSVGNTTYYVGMEDNVNGGRGFGQAATGTPASDRDYNDILIRVTAVPEPATVGLMGFGLLALAGVAKRRKA